MIFFPLVLLIIFFSNFNHLYADELFKNFNKYKKTNTNFTLEKITNSLNYPWGMTFIDKENLLITEKNGKLYKINVNNGKKIEIFHTIQSVPYLNKVTGPQQGGLLDILYHENFIYFSYSHYFDESKKESSTAIARGKLIKNRIQDLEIIFISKPNYTINKHWGSRIIIKDNQLYASFGDRDKGMVAQDASKHPGSIIRINLDGSIPDDNPHFINRPDWLPEIYLIGLRNPQGMAISPFNKKIFFSQHGPRGGDNIALVKKGANYGWKEVAWGGKEYSGLKIGTASLKKKFDIPIVIWVPSIAVSNIQFYDGEIFPDWKGDIIVASTGAKSLFKLRLRDNMIVDEEILFKNKIGRIRDLEIDAKGNVFLITDEKNSSLWKLTKTKIKDPIIP